MYDIYFDLHDMHRLVEEDEEEFWLVGEQIDFEFVKHFSDKMRQNNDHITVQRNSTGCSCEECQEFYPYAEPNRVGGAFRCWSCRNF